MKNRRKKFFDIDIRQYAISNLRVGESLEIGGVTQNIQNIMLQSSSYNHAEMIADKYKDNKDTITEKYKVKKQENRQAHQR